MEWQLAVAALLLTLGAAGAWLYSTLLGADTSEDGSSSALDAPNGPAIAVLPFVNLSGDPKQEYFSDGLTEDILTELSRARDLRVLARNATFQYKGQAVDPMQLGHQLNARYLLEGSVQRTDDRLRSRPN